MKRYRAITPIVDADLDAGDSYLAELGRRAYAARSVNAQRFAVSDWLN